MPEPGFTNTDVEKKFLDYPADLQARTLRLRKLIFEVAAETPGVGEIEEALRWGQPSYLTPATKSGTTIRMDADETHGGDFALYVNCQTSLVDQWRERYPQLSFGGTRSVHFNSAAPLPVEELRHMIGMALTYHTRKPRTR